MACAGRKKVSQPLLFAMLPGVTGHGGIGFTKRHGDIRKDILWAVPNADETLMGT
jgi:hypothetical protein